jgi:flagellar basal-body rod protein FlgC
MSLFGAIDVSGTGVNAMQSWIDADAGNIANADDTVATGTTPYEAEVANLAPASPAAADGTPGGVTVNVSAASSPGVIEQDPANPLADSKGNVLLPDISLGDQLVGLIQAQEGYSADTSAITRAVSAYQAGIGIGN